MTVNRYSLVRITSHPLAFSAQSHPSFCREHMLWTARARLRSSYVKGREVTRCHSPSSDSSPDSPDRSDRPTGRQLRQLRQCMTVTKHSHCQKGPDSSDSDLRQCSDSAPTVLRQLRQLRQHRQPGLCAAPSLWSLPGRWHATACGVSPSSVCPGLPSATGRHSARSRGCSTCRTWPSSQTSCATRCTPPSLPSPCTPKRAAGVRARAGG